MKQPEKIGAVWHRQEVICKSLFDRPKFDANLVYHFLIEQLGKQLAERSTKLVLHDLNKHVIGQIALWYSNDERFKGDLRKSLLIRGGCGTGKTQIIKALKATILYGDKLNAAFINAVELQKLYINRQDVEIEKLKLRRYTFVDDLGTESVEVKNYGNSSEPFNDLYDYRYREAKHTIVTTNLKPSEISTRYGERIIDRFRETMNDIVLDFESFRK